MVTIRSWARIATVLLWLGVVAGCGSTATQPVPPAPTAAAPGTTVSIPSPTGPAADAEVPADTTTPTVAATEDDLPAVGPTIPVESTATISAGITPTAAGEDGGMSLTVVFDNNAYDSRLGTGWGFAAWLDYRGRTVLFDTGAEGGMLLDNMRTLALDPRAIEIVVLSHIHGDHVGGLNDLLSVNPEVTVYLPQAFPTRFKKQVRQAGATVVEVSEPLELMPGLWSTGQMGTSLVEQALVARTGEGLVVITGCAHPGVDEMVTRAKEVGQDGVALVAGGFHLGSASRARVQEIIRSFQRLGVQQVAPCHCTGDKARELFRQAYGDAYHGCGAGWQW
ncbi:MAG: MBL fold metallo-hydrolase [Anaerolineae bacterium]